MATNYFTLLALTSEAAAVVAAPFVGFATQPPSPNRYPTYQSYFAPPPPPAAAAADTAASVVANRVSSRTLFYQAKIEPPPAPPTVAVVAVDIGWHAPFSAPPPRRLLFQRTYSPFVPALAVQVTADEWLSAWRGPPRYLPPKLAAQPFVPKEAVLENTVTPDAWMQPFYKAVAIDRPAQSQALIGTPPKEPITPDKWLPSWRGPPRIVELLAAGIVYAAAPAAEDNTQTIDKWKLDWNLAAKATTPIHTQPFYGFPYEGVDNTRTEWDWSIAWRGPPRYLPPKLHAQPFVPKEAVLENTVSVDQYLFRFEKAVPRPPIWATQPFYGFPYEGVDNSRSEWDWYVQWKEPPRYWPLGKPYQPFVPKEAVLENTQTPDKWLQSFRGPPRYWPVKLHAQPFVPKEATLENTVSVDQYLFRFQGAVPGRPVRPTQPFYGFPYEFAANLTTSIEWLRQWQGPPRYTPLKSYPYQPFVPKEAVLENTGTVATWLNDLDRATARRPVGFTQLPWSYAPAVQVTFGGWHQRLGRAVKARPVPVVQIGWSYPPAAIVDNTVTVEKWQLRFNTAVEPLRVRLSQPFYGYPYEQTGDAVEGGPADESERIACIPASSRTAVEPGLLRMVTVPLEQRVATVPELLRGATVPDQERVVNSNDYKDRPCHDT